MTMSARQNAIVRLLETRDEHLPEPVRRSDASSGFVGGYVIGKRGDPTSVPVRWLSCPDCLANDRVMFDCETCGGRGQVPDPGPDPYSVNAGTAKYGLNGSRHDAAYRRDREIETLAWQTRPAPKEAELLEEANRRGYGWEEARRAMYRRFDYSLLDVVLDELRHHDPVAYRALHAIFVYEWLTPAVPEKALRELKRDPGAYLTFIGGDAEQACRRGLAFLSPRLAAVELARGKALRAPGLVATENHVRGPLQRGGGAGVSARELRDTEMRERALVLVESGFSPADVTSALAQEFRVSVRTVYRVVNEEAA